MIADGARRTFAFADELGITIDRLIELLEKHDLHIQSGRAKPANTGHGHVTPRPDGAKARCGGPAICAECAREVAAQVDHGVK